MDRLSTFIIFIALDDMIALTREVKASNDIWREEYANDKHATRRLDVSNFLFYAGTST